MTLSEVIAKALATSRCATTTAAGLPSHIAAAVAAHLESDEAMGRAMAAYATEPNNWMHSTRHAPGTIARHPSGEIVDTGGLRFDKFVEREQVRAAIRAAIGGEHG